GHEHAWNLDRPNGVIEYAHGVVLHDLALAHVDQDLPLQHVDVQFGFAGAGHGVEPVAIGGATLEDHILQSATLDRADVNLIIDLRMPDLSVPAQTGVEQFLDVVGE